MKAKWRGIVFDDVTKGEYGFWTTICGACAEKLNIPEEYLDDTGVGVCGVDGCYHDDDYCEDNNIRQFYLDFPANEIEIKEE